MDCVDLSDAVRSLGGNITAYDDAFIKRKEKKKKRREKKNICSLNFGRYFYTSFNV